MIGWYALRRAVPRLLVAHVEESVRPGWSRHDRRVLSALCAHATVVFDLDEGLEPRITWVSVDEVRDGRLGAPWRDEEHGAGRAIRPCLTCLRAIRRTALCDESDEVGAG